MSHFFLPLARNAAKLGRVSVEAAGVDLLLPLTRNAAKPTCYPVEAAGVYLRFIFLAASADVYLLHEMGSG